MYPTEHKLRSFLNGKQSDREKLCLALLPTLGEYSAASPRRPEGGPDGGRDLEAVFKGGLLTWGAVGFRNDAGSSTEDRTWARNKFVDDLASALRENPALPGFVFFTNVDLTPESRHTLEKHAHGLGLKHVEVFDYHRLRHALDQPAGLLARLQYLDIEMTKEEQLALVRGFGEELQKTMTSGFSRMDNALTRLEQFLDVRKPICHIALGYTLDAMVPDAGAPTEVILTYIHNLWPISKTSLLLVARVSRPTGTEAIRSDLESWVATADSEGKITGLTNRLRFPPTDSMVGPLVAASYDIRLGAVGGNVYLADVLMIEAAVFASAGIAPHITRLQVDINGYRVLLQDRANKGGAGAPPPFVPDGVSGEALSHVLTCRHRIIHDGLERSQLVFNERPSQTRHQ